MLAEIAAANAAFTTIKTALQHGKELYDVADSCAEYFNNKSYVARRANKRGRKSDLKAFMELEKLRQQEEWIREWMIYAGRPNMYQDWLKFQSEAKKQRARELNRISRQKKKDMEFGTKCLKGVLGFVSGIASLILGVYYYG